MRARLLFIDGMRGGAATMVVFCHLGARTTAEWVTHWGYLGVAVFFVLSGFVIAMSVGDRQVSPGFLGRFAARRALRLDPPYWTSIVLAIVLGLVASVLGKGRTLPSAEAVLAHLFYMQDIVGVEAISQVYWTLCLEIQFYVFLIVMLWITQKIGGLAILWFAILLISLAEHAGLIDVAPRGIFLSYWFAFALGATAYWVSVGRMRLRLFIAAVCLTLLFTPFKHADWFIAAAATAVLILVAVRRNTMDKWLSDPVMQYLGKISYSLYLLHPLVGWTVMSVALRYADQWTALLAGLAASLLSGWLMYRLVEQPSIRLSRWVKLDGAVAQRVLNEEGPATKQR